jgi:hypothetical protein
LRKESRVCENPSSFTGFGVATIHPSWLWEEITQIFSVIFIATESALLQLSFGLDWSLVFLCNGWNFHSGTSLFSSGSFYFSRGQINGWCGRFLAAGRITSLLHSYCRLGAPFYAEENVFLNGGSW